MRYASKSVRSRILRRKVASYAFSRTAPRKSGPWRGSMQWTICGDHEVSVTLRSMPDQLSTLYSGLLEGSYDCVDRVVLNAYFGMGQTGGGLRTWWRGSSLRKLAPTA